MTGLATASPHAPVGSPPWAVAMLRDVVSWVERKLSGPLTQKVLTKSQLPTASATYLGQIRVISDDAAVGFTIVWCDGTNWKRPSATGTVS